MEDHRNGVSTQWFFLSSAGPNLAASWHIADMSQVVKSTYSTQYIYLLLFFSHCFLELHTCLAFTVYSGRVLDFTQCWVHPFALNMYLTKLTSLISCVVIFLFTITCSSESTRWQKWESGVGFFALFFEQHINFCVGNTSSCR